MALTKVAAQLLSTGGPEWTAGGVLSFNSGYGSNATAYGCRAWVNFNGTGTVAIRASGNVSSITDNGTGDYTVNFATAMVDGNYAAEVATRVDPNVFVVFGGIKSASGQTVNSVRLGCATTAAAAFDAEILNVSIFR